jgi:hypothetical protein
MADTSNIPAGLTPGLFSVLKSLMPGKEDKDVIDTYSKTADAVKQQGQDLSIIPENIQADLFKKVISGKTPAPGPEAQAAPAPQADPNAPKFPQNQVFDDKGGLGKRAAYSDPQAYVDATNKAYAKNTDGALGRFTSQAAAAYSEGLGGHAGAVDANRKRLLENDLGPANALKTAQDMANQGINTASSVAKDVSGISKEQAQLAMEKEKFVTDQRKNNVTADQAEAEWQAKAPQYDPTSMNSEISQHYAEQILGKKEGSLKHRSAAEIAGMVATMKPVTELQKQYYDQLMTKISKDNETVTSKASAAASYGSAAQSQAGAAQTQQGTAQSGQLFNQLQTGTLPGGGAYVPSITSGPTGVGIGLNQNQAVTGQQSGAAESTNKLKEAINKWDSSGGGIATDNALKIANVKSMKDTGVPGFFLSKLSSTEAGQIRTALKTQLMVNNPGISADEADKQSESLLRNGTSESITKQLAIGKAARAVQGHMFDAQSKHLLTPESKGVLGTMNYSAPTAYFNRKTSDVKLGENADDEKVLLGKGYTKLSGAQ